MGLFTKEERAEYNAEQDVIQALRKAMNVSKVIGQGEEVTKLKEQLDFSLKQSQEAYEFLKVLMNRHSTGFNKLDHDTHSYIKCAMTELAKIEGIKK